MPHPYVYQIYRKAASINKWENVANDTFYESRVDAIGAMKILKTSIPGNYKVQHRKKPNYDINLVKSTENAGIDKLSQIDDESRRKAVEYLCNQLGYKKLDAWRKVNLLRSM